MKYLAVFAVGMALGCSGFGGVVPVSVEVPESETGIHRKLAVRIAKVRDRRHFDYVARSPRTPAIKNAAILGKQGTRRVIGRSRSGSGGNLMLPEGSDVDSVTRDVLTRAFREAGYAVTDSEDAVPVEAEILEFWTWMTERRFGLPSFEFRTRVSIRGEVPPFNGAGETLCGEHFNVGTRHIDTWTKTVAAGLSELGEHVRRRLESPMSAVPNWYCTPIELSDEPDDADARGPSLRRSQARASSTESTSAWSPVWASR